MPVISGFLLLAVCDLKQQAVGFTDRVAESTCRPVATISYARRVPKAEEASVEELPRISGDKHICHLGEAGVGRGDLCEFRFGASGMIEVAQ